LQSTNLCFLYVKALNVYVARSSGILVLTASDYHTKFENQACNVSFVSEARAAAMLILLAVGKYKGF
jgi:hypothetical protein